MGQDGIRLLRAGEIECRVGTISEKGLSLLLYKDARADMKILDEVFGMLGWQRHHEMIGGSLYCIVSVWDAGKLQWIEKMDVGTESYTEKEKGQASDSFKRACVSLGIGRELYTAPFIWIPAGKVKLMQKGEGNNVRYYTYDKFSVSSISYNENREITGLSIMNQDGKVVYCLMEQGGVAQEQEAPDKDAGNSPTKASGGKRGKASGNSVTKKAEDAGTTESSHVEEINKELARTGVALDAVLERYGVSSIAEMSESTYKKAISSLKKTKSAA